MVSYSKSRFQPYPRDSSGYLALDGLFPKLNPPMPLEQVQDAIRMAFERAKKDNEGQMAELSDTPDKLVKLCLQHLRL